MEGRGVGSPGPNPNPPSACEGLAPRLVWRLSYVVDSCNVVATEHSRYGPSCTYVESIECMSSAGSV